ncbi:hypothetical protein RD110_02255 [Rhodoferax koreense]|uniref:Uncharacterized protein n=1 Tax=Rhodoferax koreensis TaxID=1842727 RepID=A0A1P8JR23_9BURK|nr:hypothetical protein [Rhodoferax koreense]APW36178.1 hypothetical protein RD110_02255 [Rhodoferax koreense]
MQLHYLDFDYSEDDAGNGVFDAMAAAWPEQLAALHAEVATVLGWAHAQFGEPGPIDEEADWDVDLGSLVETSERQTLAFDPVAQRLTAVPGAPGQPRHTVSVSISGRPAFCAALRERFGLDGP